MDYRSTLTVKIITNETFRAHQGFGLALFRDATMPPSTLLTYRVAKQEPFLDFKSRLAQALRYQPNQFRLWLLSTSRYNSESRGLRPNSVVPQDDPELKMSSVNPQLASGFFCSSGELVFYLEVLDPTGVAPDVKHDSENRIIFVKYFDASRQTLTGIDHFYVSHYRVTSQLPPLLNKRMNLPRDTPLQFYKEVDQGSILDLSKSTNCYMYSSDEPEVGDIYCFQVKPSDHDPSHSRLAELKRQKLCINAEEFYDFLKERVQIEFKPRHDAMAATIEFSLILSRKFTYDQMAAKVSERLHHDPKLLRFTNSHKGNPQNVILQHNTVADMMQLPNMDPSSHRSYGRSSSPSEQLSKDFFYELLDLPTGEVQPKRMVKITWTGAHNREEGRYSLLMPTASSINDLVEKLSTLVHFSKNSSRKIKLFTIRGDQIEKHLLGYELLKDVPDDETMYAAEASAMTVQQFDPAAMLKMLEFVTKLNVDGSNYEQWLRALESILGMATGKVKLLTTPGHTISDAEDLMIKQAIAASVDDALVLAVLEAETGLAAFVEIQKRYTLHSRNGHIRIMKEILQTKFNARDTTADIKSHFQRIEHLAKVLFGSGFVLTQESFIGLFFHLSLPELDSQPFVNVCRKIDERPGGASIVSNADLLKIAQTELARFRQ
ncbi:hypothetical protein Pst134EB_018405 [Puccinia striiformis f. sp. tritici]|nr:hypothetical protein Pst134EB_018405 [Puccinia striiformis f. sp. tritici]